LKLDYVVPLSEGSVEIQTFVEDVTDVRFGLPLTYKVQIVTGGNKSKYLTVHHTRMIHITGELIDGEVYGVPALEPVWNRLMDLEKLVGGSAEMYWKGARPGYSGKVDKDVGISADLQDEMKAQMEEYEHGLRRFLIGKGLDIESLAPQVSDPTNHVEVQIQMISAVTGIPKRILTGSERGELASTQDKEAWNTLIMARREEFAEAQIIKPFTERMMEYGILPKRDSYTVEWESLYVVSDKDKAEVGRIRAQSLKDYTLDVQEIMPPEAFFRHVLNLTDDIIDEIWVIQDEEMRSEGRDTNIEEGQGNE
jgi:hypothetical protein